MRSILTLTWMRTPFQEDRDRNPAPLRTQVREGVALAVGALVPADERAHLRGRQLRLLGGSTSSSSSSRKRHGLSPAAIGALIAVFGCASLAGSLVASRVAKRLSIRSIMVGNEWLSAALILCASRPARTSLLACTLPDRLLLADAQLRRDRLPDGDHTRPPGRARQQRRPEPRPARRSRSVRWSPGFLLGAFSPRVTMLVLGGIALALAVWTTVEPVDPGSRRACPSSTAAPDLSVEALRRNRDFLLHQSGQLLSIFGRNISGSRTRC